MKTWREHDYEMEMETIVIETKQEKHQSFPKW